MMRAVNLLHGDLTRLICAPQSMYNVFFQAYDWRSFIIAVVASGVGLLLAALLENLLIRPLLGDVCAPCMPHRREAAATLPPPDDAQKLQQQSAAGPGMQHANGAPGPASTYAAYEKM
jgi:hypothetical protein